MKIRINQQQNKHSEDFYCYYCKRNGHQFKNKTNHGLALTSWLTNQTVKNGTIVISGYLEKQVTQQQTTKRMKLMH